MKAVAGRDPPPQITHNSFVVENNASTLQQLLNNYTRWSNDDALSIESKTEVYLRWKARKIVCEAAIRYFEAIQKVVGDEGEVDFNKYLDSLWNCREDTTIDDFRLSYDREYTYNLPAAARDMNIEVVHTFFVATLLVSACIIPKAGSSAICMVLSIFISAAK